MIYKTIEKATQIELVIKKSRFIGHSMPVSTQEQALDFIASIKKLHKTATHNVYAYVLREQNVIRYSDDGEPSGTAGMPVLDCILKSSLSNVAVVVTRYFGGTMLGAGGLVHAYSNTASEVLSASKPIEMALCSRFCIECDYNMLGKIQHEIAKIGANISSTDFSDNVIVHIDIEKEKSSQLNFIITEISGGKIIVNFIDDLFLPISYFFLA